MVRLIHSFISRTVSNQAESASSTRQLQLVPSCWGAAFRPSSIGLHPHLHKDCGFLALLPTDALL